MTDVAFTLPATCANGSRPNCLDWIETGHTYANTIYLAQIENFTLMVDHTFVGNWAGLSRVEHISRSWAGLSRVEHISRTEVVTELPAPFTHTTALVQQSLLLVLRSLSKV